MATPPQLRQLNGADYPDAPPWFRRFLAQMSPFTAQVTDALGGQLGTENLRKQVQPLTLKTKATVLDTFADGRVRLKNRLGVKPTSVVLARVVPADAGPATHRVRAQYASNAGQSIADATAYVRVNLEDAVSDPHGIVTVGTSWAAVIPPGGAGLYRIGASLSFQGGSIPLVELWAAKAGVAFKRMAGDLATDSVAGSCELDLVAGDSVSVMTYQNSGGARSLSTDPKAVWVDIACLDGPQLGVPLWTLTTGGDIRIDAIPGLRPSTEYQLTFVVE